MSDTPAVAIPNYRCTLGIDSCPGGGVDLIKNFMDYTEDSCMDSFTTGQFTRAQSMWSAFRASSAYETGDESSGSNQASSSLSTVHTALYVVGGLLGVAAVAAGVLYKKKRDQDALDAEFVGAVAGTENPMQQEVDEEAAGGVELSGAATAASGAQEQGGEVVNAL